MFSISDIASAVSSGTSRTRAGISVSPAICAARQRRSPAISSNESRPSGRTSTGCINPFARIDAASSFKASGSIFVRGWYLPGRIALTGIVPSASLRSPSSAPSSASSPRPSPLSLLTVCASCGISIENAGARENLVRQRNVGLRPLRRTVPDHGWGAEARRFGEPHVARHERAVHLFAEMLLELLRYLMRQRVSGVVHRAQQARDLQARIDIGAHPLDRADEIG